MAVGLGGEQLWLSPTVANNVNPFNDQSGQGNNGTAQGGLSTVADTGAGGAYCYDFDGTDDYIDCGNILDGASGGNDSAVSYTSWMLLDSYSNNNNAYGTAWMGKCNTVSNGGYVLGNVQGVIALVRFPNNSTGAQYLETKSSVAEIPLSTWKHVAVTYSGCETTGCTVIYIDGVVVSITETNSSYGIGMGTNTDALKIGTTLSSMTFKRMMNGKIDDLRVYNRVITQAEITHLATSRGVLGPPGGATHYNPFKSHAFINDFQQRLR